MKKRVFDFIVALLLLGLLCPIFILCALMVRLGSRGPVIYFSKRVLMFGSMFIGLEASTSMVFGGFSKLVFLLCLSSLACLLSVIVGPCL